MANSKWALLALALAAGHAGAAPGELAGVWRGSLGQSAITVCFNSSNETGSYYYQRYLTPIRLAPAQPGAPWAEEGNTGLWQLDAVQADRLTGTWRCPSP
jgi:hypothetical protein